MDLGVGHSVGQVAKLRTDGNGGQKGKRARGEDGENNANKALRRQIFLQEARKAIEEQNGVFEVDTELFRVRDDAAEEAASRLSMVGSASFARGVLVPVPTSQFAPQGLGLMGAGAGRRGNTMVTEAETNPAQEAALHSSLFGSASFARGVLVPVPISQIAPQGRGSMGAGAGNRSRDQEDDSEDPDSDADWGNGEEDYDSDSEAESELQLALLQSARDAQAARTARGAGRRVCTSQDSHPSPRSEAVGVGVLPAPPAKVRINTCSLYRIVF